MKMKSGMDNTKDYVLRDNQIRITDFYAVDVDQDYSSLGGALLWTLPRDLFS